MKSKPKLGQINFRIWEDLKQKFKVDANRKKLSLAEFLIIGGSMVMDTKRIPKRYR